MKYYNWREFELVDGEGHIYRYGDERYTAAMIEYRNTGSILGLWFTKPLQYQENLPQDAWGPSRGVIEWTASTLTNRQEILEALNSYEGGNLWEDIVMALPLYDWERTDREEDVHRSEAFWLTTGEKIEWNPLTREWEAWG